MYNFTLIGDSLTNHGFFYKNGWPQLLKNLLPTVNIINFGFNGYNSSQVKNIINMIITKEQPIHFATILLGTNDCFSHNNVTPEEYKKNIEFILHTILSLYPTCVIYLITPPICKIIKNNIQDFISQLYLLGQNFPTITIVDLHKSNFPILLEDFHDGVHFNENGHNKIFLTLLNKIQEKYY